MIILVAACVVGIAIGFSLRNRAVPFADGSDQIGLRVAHQGNDFEISWDRSSRLLQAAGRGRLLIEDGSDVRAVELDARTLRGGHVVYTPLKQDVSVRLEVITGDQRTQTATVVMLGAPREIVSPPPRPAPELREPAPPPVVRAASYVEPEEVSSRSIPRPDPEPEERAMKSFHPPPVRAAGITATPVLPAPDIASIQSASSDMLRLGALPRLRPPSEPVAPATPARSSTYAEPVALERMPIRVPDMVRAALSGIVKVTVKAKIDRSGRVTSVRAVSVEGNPGPYIADLRAAATTAARAFVFRPATLNGVPIEIEQMIQFVIGQ